MNQIMKGIVKTLMGIFVVTSMVSCKTAETQVRVQDGYRSFQVAMPIGKVPQYNPRYEQRYYPAIYGITESGAYRPMFVADPVPAGIPDPRANILPPSVTRPVDLEGEDKKFFRRDNPGAYATTGGLATLLYMVLENNSGSGGGNPDTKTVGGDDRSFCDFSGATIHADVQCHGHDQRSETTSP